MKTNKVNFFKKIYYSIFKIKEYGNLSKVGIKNSLYYVMDLIVICSIVYASILTFQMKSNANNLQEYLEQNFPTLTYEDGKLQSENLQRTVLNHDLVKVNFGGQIIIDTITDNKTLINEYKNNQEPTIILTANKYVTINSKGDISQYNYDEIINTGESKEQTIINKEYFISSFSNISYSYYFFGYLIGSCIGTSIIVFLYNLLTTGMAFIVCKIKKIKAKYGEIYSMGLYAQTISIFGYFMINLLPTTMALYIQLLSLLIPIGYLVYAIYINKWIMPE